MRKEPSYIPIHCDKQRRRDMRWRYRALNDPEVVRRISTVGMEPTPTTPEEFYAFLESEIASAAKARTVSSIR